MGKEYQLEDFNSQYVNEIGVGDTIQYQGDSAPMYIDNEYFSVVEADGYYTLKCLKATGEDITTLFRATYNNSNWEDYKFQIIQRKIKINYYYYTAVGKSEKYQTKTLDYEWGQSLPYGLEQTGWKYYGSYYNGEKITRLTEDQFDVYEIDSYFDRRVYVDIRYSLEGSSDPISPDDPIETSGEFYSLEGYLIQDFPVINGYTPTKITYEFDGDVKECVVGNTILLAEAKQTPIFLNVVYYYEEQSFLYKVIVNYIDINGDPLSNFNKTFMTNEIKNSHINVNGYNIEEVFLDNNSINLPYKIEKDVSLQVVLKEIVNNDTDEPSEDDNTNDDFENNDNTTNQDIIYESGWIHVNGDITKRFIPNTAYNHILLDDKSTQFIIIGSDAPSETLKEGQLYIQYKDE